MLEADLGAPRKQRHTAKRIFDLLVEERGYAGSYSAVQRYVREWRLARAAGACDGYLELEWAPGVAQADYGNFEAEVTGERLRLKLLVVALPHSNARHAVAGMSQRAERVCAGLAEIFGRVGRAPRELAPGSATEAGRRVRGEVTESHLSSLFRAHYRMGSRYCNPYSGNEKGSVENAVGFLRRNLLVPVPRVGTLAELSALLRAGCERLNAKSRARDGRPTPAALVARPRAFGESVIRRDMPEGLVRAIDSLDAAGRRRVLRAIGRASGPSGFGAACAASLKVFEGGRVPDDATVDVLARRMAVGAPAATGGADLSVYDGFLRGG